MALVNTISAKNQGDETQQTIVQFFVQFIKKDAATQLTIGRFQGDVFIAEDNTNLVFSLHGLYLMLSPHEAIDYNLFRKIIYQGNINEILQKQGYKIDLYQSNGKVDDNLYQLIAT